MKDILIQALDAAFDVVTNQARQTKNKTFSVSIENIKPKELKKFIKDNSLPDTAYFDVSDCEDMWIPCLCWDIKVPYTDKEQAEHNRRVFNSGLAFRAVYKWAIKEGYTRVGFDSGLLKEFDNTTVFDMYMEKDFDRLVKYYSLYFKKDQ